MELALYPPITLERLLLDSGLNEDCLLEIFTRMNIDDLLVFCDFNLEHNSFLKLIKKYVASKIVFDLDAISIQRKWTVTKVFGIFGSKMTKIKMTVSIMTFSYLLEKILPTVTQRN